MKPGKKPARGFTLLEILVALTMFAVVGGALLQLFGSGLKNARVATEQTHATLLARSKLTELMADPELTEGVLEGEFGDGYAWTAELTPLEDEDESLQNSFRELTPLELSLTITWGDANEEKAFTLKSLLLAQATPQ